MLDDRRPRTEFDNSDHNVAECAACETRTLSRLAASKLPHCHWGDRSLATCVRRNLGFRCVLLSKCGIAGVADLGREYRNRAAGRAAAAGAVAADGGLG